MHLLLKIWIVFIVIVLPSSDSSSLKGYFWGHRRSGSVGKPISDYEKYLSQFLQPDKDPTEGNQISEEHFEGDIIMKGKDPYAAQDENRRMIRGMNLWSDGVVPYIIENTFDEGNRLQVARAFSEIEAVSCVKFKPRDNERNYLYFQKGKDCASHVGRLGGGQPISLAPDCVSYGVILHEILHSLGFWHEQSRQDRSEYIDIHWSNIKPLMLPNFMVNPLFWMSDVGLPYDYDSILHYGSKTFARDPSKETITPKNGEVTIGQRQRLSEMNIQSINLLYHCDDSDFGNLHGRNLGYTNPDYLDSNAVNIAQNFEDNSDVCEDLSSFCWPSRMMGVCWWGNYYSRRYCRKTCGDCDSKK